MELPLYIFLAGAVITLTGWMFLTRRAHALAIQRDRDNREYAASTAKDGRKREFRAAISAVRDGFDTTPGEELVLAHQASTVGVRDQCSAILEDIDESGRAGFQRARDGYLGLKRDQIECRDWSKKVDLATPHARYDLGRARLRQLLDELIKHVK